MIIDSLDGDLTYQTYKLFVHTFLPFLVCIVFACLAGYLMGKWEVSYDDN